VDAIRLRPAQTDDFERILAINEEGWPGVSPLTPPELAAVSNDSPFFGVAELDRDVVGYVIAYTDANIYDGEEFNWLKRSFAHFLYIDQIAIARPARHAGVGARIYGLLEQYARQQALTSMACEVNLDPPNPVSLAFHTRQRFVEVGTLTTSDGRVVSLLRKDLAT
jgi:uncharacterized protein